MGVYMENNNIAENANVSKYAARLNLDSILGFVLTLLSVFFIFYIVPVYIEEPETVSNIMMSPRYIPNIAGWFVFVLSVFLTIQGFSYPKKHKEFYFFDTPITRWLLMLVALTAYAFLFEELGAIVCAFFASVCLLLANHISKAWLYALMLVFPVLIYLLFVYVLHVPLPLGDLWS